jgi:hypothetical protein
METELSHRSHHLCRPSVSDFALEGEEIVEIFVLVVYYRLSHDYITLFRYMYSHA